MGGGNLFGWPLCNGAFDSALQQLLTIRIRKPRSRPVTSSGSAPGLPTRFCWAPVGRKWVSPSATFLRIYQPRSDKTRQRKLLPSLLSSQWGTTWCAAAPKYSANLRRSRITQNLSRPVVQIRCSCARKIPTSPCTSGCLQTTSSTIRARGRKIRLD